MWNNVVKILTEYDNSQSVVSDEYQQGQENEILSEDDQKFYIENTEVYKNLLMQYNEIKMENANLKKNSDFTSNINQQQGELINNLSQQLEEFKQQNSNLMKEIQNLKSNFSPTHPDPLMTAGLEPPSTCDQELRKAREELANTREDLNRLRNHLVNVERDNEEIIFDLKTKLEQMTEKQEAAKLNPEIIQNNGQHLINENLKKEIIALKSEVHLKQSELDNLQSLIEQLQVDQTQEIEVRTYHLSMTINSQTEKIKDLEVKAIQLDQVLEKNKEMKLETEKLKEQLATKTKEYNLLVQEYQPLRGTLDQTLRKLNFQIQNNQEVIDKQIVTKLIITYIKSLKKREVLEVMAGILNFTEQQKIEVGLLQDPNSKNKGWLTGWFGPAPTIPNNKPKEELDGKNFTDLWIQFLIQEAEKNNFPQSEIVIELEDKQT